MPRPRRLLLTAAIAVAVAAVVLSPFLLGTLNGLGVNWTRLSEIGQTYGAVSAVLSALALGAVAMSVAIQRRQARAEQIQAVRGFHLDLVRMQLDDLPTYLPCWGPLDLPGPQAQRRHVYTGLIFSYGSMGYGVGEISEPWLRNMVGGMFRNEFARRYWRTARESWVASAGGNRRGLRFVAIVDDEFDRAVAAGPPVQADRPPRRRRTVRRV
jgi:Family of unknown function (DUF6082)